HHHHPALSLVEPAGKRGVTFPAGVWVGAGSGGMPSWGGTYAPPTTPPPSSFTQLSIRTVAVSARMVSLLNRASVPRGIVLENWASRLVVQNPRENRAS